MGAYERQAVVATSENSDGSTKPIYSVYPNPATTLLYIVDNAAAATSSASLYNELGGVVRSVEFVGNTTLSVEDLPSGLYFLKVLNRQEQTSSTHRILITRP